MANDFEARLEKLLTIHGLTWRYARRRKHMSVVVRHQGRDVTFIYPASGSDRRGARNLTAIMKRKLGLRRISV